LRSEAWRSGRPGEGTHRGAGTNADSHRNAGCADDIESATPEPEADAEAEPEPEPREMAPDEIAVDGVVMKKAVRGTSRDPRASEHEQWIVKVQTTAGRIFNVPADQPRFDKLRVGDRVQVVYRVGKYTGTVWSADLE
jgi:hypothetical protein